MSTRASAYVHPGVGRFAAGVGLCPPERRPMSTRVSACVHATIGRFAARRYLRGPCSSGETGHVSPKRSRRSISMIPSVREGGIECVGKDAIPGPHETPSEHRYERTKGYRYERTKGFGGWTFGAERPDGEAP